MKVYVLLTFFLLPQFSFRPRRNCLNLFLGKELQFNNCIIFSLGIVNEQNSGIPVFRHITKIVWYMMEERRIGVDFWMICTAASITATSLMCHVPFVHIFDIRIVHLFFQLRCLIQIDIRIWPFLLALEWKHWMTDELFFNESIFCCI